MSFLKKKYPIFSKALALGILMPFVCLSVSIPNASAQTVLNLPEPGTMVPLSQSYAPAAIMGMTVHADDPFLFDFIVQPGDEHLKGADFTNESKKLIKYFMAALTIPEDEMWVNLSPYEKDRIIPSGFGDTEMGRDLLAQDYMLKQLTSSLMYPDEKLGGDFWDRVYRKAKEKYGTTEIPMNTFNKVWIVPDKAVIYEHGTSVFVVESYLKVMLEEDYLALESNVGSDKHGLGAVKKEDLTHISEVSSEIIRDLIIPEIEKEVNEGKTFANLRQITNAIILATWYKQNVQGSILEQMYINQNRTEGIDTEDKEINQKIYAQYVEAFKKGVYDFIKEDYDESTQEIIPRKYFSGGANLDYAKAGIDRSGDGKQLEEKMAGALEVSARMRNASNDATIISTSDETTMGKKELSELADTIILVHPRKEYDMFYKKHFSEFRNKIFLDNNGSVPEFIRDIESSVINVPNNMGKMTPPNILGESAVFMGGNCFACLSNAIRSSAKSVFQNKGKKFTAYLPAEGIWTDAYEDLEHLLSRKVVEGDSYDYTQKLLKRLFNRVIQSQNFDDELPPNTAVTVHFNGKEYELNMIGKNQAEFIVDVEILRPVDYDMIGSDRSGDFARENNIAKKGGIDMNPQNIDIQKRGESMQIRFPAFNQRIPFSPADGFAPAIINITPVIDIPALIGLK